MAEEQVWEIERQGEPKQDWWTDKTGIGEAHRIGSNEKYKVDIGVRRKCKWNWKQIIEEVGEEIKQNT
jgi:hypothetical protein